MAVTQGFKAKVNQQHDLIRNAAFMLRQLAQQDGDAAEYVQCIRLFQAEKKRVLMQEEQLKALDQAVQEIDEATHD